MKAKLKDPLAEITRKERKALLVIATLAIAIVEAGLLPTRINAFGIELETIDQVVLLKLLSFIVMYFLIGFIVYGSADFIYWRSERLKELQTELAEEVEWKAQPRSTTSEVQMSKYEIMDLIRMKMKPLRIASTPISLFRSFFDFLLPIFLSLYSIYIYFYHLIRFQINQHSHRRLTVPTYLTPLHFTLNEKTNKWLLLSFVRK